VSRRLAVPVLIGTIALAGCGSGRPAATRTSSNPTTTAPVAPVQTLSRAQAARRYSADIAHVNAVGAQVSSQLSASDTQAQVTQLTHPYVEALIAVNTRLSALAADYPPAAADIRATISADTDLMTALTKPQITSAAALADDAKATRTASAKVRTDLGLPPHAG
jgi:hypothetical protein